MMQNVLLTLINQSAAGAGGQGTVLQSVVSLTGSLVVKMLTVLVSTISNSQVFFAEKKCE